MGTKRLLTIVIVVAFVLGSIVALLFQGGADEQVIDRVLPRLEDRLGVSISYRDVSASLTGISLEGVQIRDKTSKAAFAVIDRLGIGIRVGPLLLGDLDITGIRFDGIELRIGAGKAGATLSDWATLAKSLTAGGTFTANTDKPVSGRPEIQIGGGSIVYDDDRFTAEIRGISGTIGADRRAAVDIDEFEIIRGGRKILQGESAQIQYSSKNRTLAIRTLKPRLELPVGRENLLSIARDGKATLRQFEDARDIIDTSSRGEPDGAVASSAAGKIESWHLVVAEATGKLVDSGDSGERLSIDDITVDVTAKETAPVTLRASGQLPGTDARWTLGATIPKQKDPKLTLEVPDMSLAEVGGIMFGAEHIQWSEAFAETAVALEVTRGGQILTLSGQIAVSGLTLNHERLSATPLESLSAHGDFKLSYDREAAALHLERFLVSRGLARATVRGDILLERLAFDLFVNVPSTSCRQIFSAIPEALRTRLKGVQLDGNLGLDLHLAMDDQKTDDVVLEAALNNQCRVTENGGLPEANYFRGPFSYNAYTQNGEDLRLVTGPGTDRWTPLALISPFIIEAVLTTEDGKFWRHKGLTLPEIRRAISLNLKKESLRHGASTITMQLAKNLFLTRERSVARKLQELFLVWYLETNFAKEELLELYLNVVEFGPSLYGIRDAAEHYFGREPAELNAMESVFLIKLLPNPVARHRTYVRGALTERQKKNLHRVLRTMKDRDRIAEIDFSNALQQEIVFFKEGDPRPTPRLPVRPLGSPELQAEAIDSGESPPESDIEEAIWE